MSKNLIVFCRIYTEYPIRKNKYQKNPTLQDGYFLDTYYLPKSAPLNATIFKSWAWSFASIVFLCCFCFWFSVAISCFLNWAILILSCLVNLPLASRVLIWACIRFDNSWHFNCVSQAILACSVVLETSAFTGEELM